MGIKYVGATRDFSGYGEAGRNDIASLITAGIDVTVKPLQFVTELCDFGDLGALCMDREDKDIPYEAVILHLTPNIFPKHKEEGKYTIGRVFWETDKIPTDFAKGIEQGCDEVWTGSKYNEDAIRKAGVTKPIFIIPEAIDTTVRKEQFSPYLTPATDTFSFYSIFEWTFRKNPFCLLEAYFTEFQNGENVSLNLKTYVDNFTAEKKEEITFQIEEIKARLGFSAFPPVYLFRHLMDRGQIYRFHSSFNCFISAHRGEGWGIPQMEALLLGNPVISTDCGGIHEYLTDKQDAYLLPYTLIPLSGNSRNQSWYLADQQWAEVDIEDARKAMRFVYENQEEAHKTGGRGSAIVREKFSLLSVGSMMRDRLEEISYVL